MLRTLRRVPSVARIVFAPPRSAVRVSMVRLPLSALPTPQGSSTEEWSLIVALYRPRQGRQKANFCTALGSLWQLLFSPFYRRATWSVGRPGAAFSTPMSVRCGGAFPEGARVARVATSPPQRPYHRNWTIIACQIHAVYHQGAHQVGPSLWYSPANPFSSTACPLVLGSSHIAEFYMIFISKLLHPAPLMNSPSSSTCSHLLLVTSSHLDFPGGVMTRLSSPVGVQALLGRPGFRA